MHGLYSEGLYNTVFAIINGDKIPTKSKPRTHEHWFLRSVLLQMWIYTRQGISKPGPILTIQVHELHVSYANTMHLPTCKRRAPPAKRF